MSLSVEFWFYMYLLIESIDSNMQLTVKNTTVTIIIVY